MGVRGSEESPEKLVLLRSAASHGAAAGSSAFPSTSGGRSGALGSQDEPQPPSHSEGDPRRPVPAVGAPRHGRAGKPGADKAGSRPGPPRFPGGGPRKHTGAAALPPPAPAEGNSRRPGAGRCQRGAAPGEPLLAGPGKKSRSRPPPPSPPRRARPRGSASPARRSRRSREAPLQRRRHTNFHRKTLGPGGLGRGPRLNGAPPAPPTPPVPAGGSPRGQVNTAFARPPAPPPLRLLKPVSLRGELHSLPASERPWD